MLIQIVGKQQASLNTILADQILSHFNDILKIKTNFDKIFVLIHKTTFTFNLKISTMNTMNTEERI